MIFPKAVHQLICSKNVKLYAMIFDFFKTRHSTDFFKTFFYSFSLKGTAEFKAKWFTKDNMILKMVVLTKY